ncbi:claudin-4-like isoform X1 [Oncorhynchus kisutch]|nr:claudin-4-like isoform X1 [Oncorhynchus kisutch]
MLMGMEIVGIVLGVMGLITTIVVCALPTWMETTFTVANFVTTEEVWDGLWMSCVKRSTSHIQCEVYDSMPSSAWSSNLQATRAMTIMAIILGFLGVMVSMVGHKTTNYIKLIILTGIFFILAGFLILIPVSWKARTILIDSSNELTGEKRELGGALYFGWGAAAFLLIGGAILSRTLYTSGTEVAAITTGVIGWIISMVTWACALGMLDLLQYRMKLILSFFSFMLGLILFLGLIFFLYRCTNCNKRNPSEAEVINFIGLLFIMAGLTQLIFTSFVAFDLTQNLNPDNFLQSNGLMFSAEPIRWAASMLLIGGTILCCCCCFKQEKPELIIDSIGLNRILHVGESESSK